MNQISLPNLKLSLKVSFVALLSFVWNNASIQAAAETDTDPKKDDAITLTPFEVRTDRDVGYTAASALAGGRTDTPLKDTPAAVSVMTRQFIDDIGATNFQQIAEWGVNSQPTYSGSLANNPFDFGINLRGPNSSFPSRNYYVWYINSDSYSTERYEYARGPNGVLFGDGNLGGIVTIFSKQPRFGQQFSSLNFRADTYGGYSTRIDINQPVTDRVAVRLNILDVRDQNWRDRLPFRNRGAHLGTAMRLTDRTTLRSEGEIGRGQRAVAPLSYADQASYWDGRTSYDGTNAPSLANTGVGRVSNSPYLLYVPSMPQAGVSDWSTFYKTSGTGIPIRPSARADIQNFPVLPSEKFNLQPPNSWQRLNFYTYTFYLEHRITDNLFAQVAYNRLENQTIDNNNPLYNGYTIDVNRVLPNGLPNPKFGVPYSDNQIQRGHAGNMVDDLRAFLAYRVETTWAKEHLNAIIGTRLDRFNLLSETVYRTNGTNPNLTNAANQFRERIYWDTPGKYFLPNGVPTLPDSGYTFDYFPNNVINQRKSIDYAQLASTSQFFHDHLTVMLGVRKDVFHQTQRSTTAALNDPVTGLPRLGATYIPPGEKNPRSILGGKLDQEFKPLSKNAGAVYFLVPWLGFYANYSETFATPNAGANLIDGTTPGISRSKGQDYGIKFYLWDGKVDARLNYYRSQQDNLLVNSINTTETDRIWNNLGHSELAGIQWRDTQTLQLNGYEFEATANPIRDFRMTFNLAFPDAKNVDVYPRFKAYVAQNLAAWQAGANDPNNSQAAQMRQDIATIQTALSNLVTGAISNGTYKYTSNVYGTYTFHNGALKNFSTGLGANIRGKAKIGNTTASPYDYLYSNNYSVLSGHLAYEKHFGKIDAIFQLNVYNVLDNRDLVTTSYADYRVLGLSANPATRLANAFRYLDPRKFTFSTTFTY